MSTKTQNLHYISWLMNNCNFLELKRIQADCSNKEWLSFNSQYLWNIKLLSNLDMHPVCSTGMGRSIVCRSHKSIPICFPCKIRCSKLDSQDRIGYPLSRHTNQRNSHKSIGICNQLYYNKLGFLMLKNIGCQMCKKWALSVLRLCWFLNKK